MSAFFVLDDVGLEEEEAVIIELISSNNAEIVAPQVSRDRT